MQVKYNLLVDFAYPNKSNIVMISENDTNSRVCHFTMLFNKEAFDMTDVVGARVKGIRGDNIIISDTATIMQDALGKNTNVLEYSIPLTISEYTGKTTMAITLVGEDGSEITSFEFYVSTRNALYNEDDVVTEEETQSFSQLLNRIQQKLAELENIASITAIKNPMPINIFLDGKEYNYIGDKEVNIELGNIAYIDEKNPLDPEEAVDETAARAAVDAANRIDGDIEALKGLAPQIEAASDYAAQARQSATDAYNYAQELNVVPQIIVGEKSGGERPITIITAAGTQVATIVDGLQGERGEKGDPGEKGERGERGLNGNSLTAESVKRGKTTTVTIKDSGTGTTINTFDVQDGADGEGTGNMNTATYDVNGHGYVDNAEAITDGANRMTYSDISTAIAGKITKPSSAGTAGQALVTDGEGNYSWGDVATDQYIESTSDDFNVIGKKLSLADAITDKLSEIDEKSKITWQQNTTSGTKIAEITINEETIDVYAPTSGGGGGTTDYSALTSKPKINNVELVGNKTSAQLGLASVSDLPTNTSDLNNDSGFITSTDIPPIPSEVTEATVSGWGFTKNKGTYIKPSGGIPSSDLDSEVATILDSVGEKIAEPSTKNADDVLVWNGSEWVAQAPSGGGHEMISTVSGVEAVTSADDEHVVSAYAIKSYSNRYTRSIISTLNANTNSWSLTDSLFANDNATFEFFFEPNSKNEVITLASYTLNTTSGALTLTFGEKPTVNTRIRIDVTVYRAE